MARTYDEDNITTLTGFESTSLITLVRNWSNRDSTALPDYIIKDALRYSADTAYRSLEIPPFENTVYYVLHSGTPSFKNTNNTTKVGTLTTGSSAANSTAQASLPIPADLVDYMYIRKMGKASKGIGTSASPYEDTTANGIIDFTLNAAGSTVMFNAKTDTRTFYDPSAIKPSSNFWTRMGNNTLISATKLNEGDIIELHYRRRLFALDSRFAVTGDETVVNASIHERAPASFTVNGINYTKGTRNSTTKLLAYTPATGSTTITFPAFTVGSTDYRGKLVRNWLRDENDKVLLFGALKHCFEYLSDIEEVERYEMKWQQAIAEVNNEEKMRALSGGNIQMNYSANLI